MSDRIKVFLIGFIVLSSCKNLNSDVKKKAGRDWPVYGGDGMGSRYSPLKEINTGNVQALKLAWTYDTGENNDSTKRGHEIQCQPIVVDGVMYITSPELDLIALKAGTGEQIWKFQASRLLLRFNTNRGVVYWQNGSDKRIFYSAGSSLFAVNASTGQLVDSFGEHGKVDLHEGLEEGIGHSVKDLLVTATSPGAVYKNTLIMGSSVSESGDAAPGHVRGFDAITGKMKWIFHTIPQPGEFGYDTWPKDAYRKFGGTNDWSGMVVDDKRGMVYFGTGSASSDFYGGAREGMDLFSNCVLALDAETGKMKWYFQTIHHDLWDRDIPSPPNLLTVMHDGKKVDALAQTTKDGIVYILDRDKGTSLFPIEEKPVPTEGLPGEHPWPTQRFPTRPKPFTHQEFTEADITDISPESHAFVKKRFMELPKAQVKFIPPSEEGTFAFGYSGGSEWGGNAVDPAGVIYINENEAPWELQMISQEDRRKEIASLSKGNALFVTNCAPCHGSDRLGNGKEFPSLVNIGKKRAADDIKTLLKNGSGRMPSFQYIPENDRNAIVAFLLNPASTQIKAVSEHSEAQPSAASEQEFPYQPRYVNKVWKKVVDQNGYPGIKPPWGTLNAIDLNTGEYLWRVPLGEYPELTKKGIPITGTESYGGPLATAGGLIFIAGTRDERLRAFDKKTGKQVWEYQLPAGGFATPVTYEVDGRQYVVIAAGGSRFSRPGGKFLAFALN